MIKNIFGKPAMPLIVEDCLLIIRKDKVIPIDKVYLFTKLRRFPVRSLGDLWMTDLIMDIKKFSGYFKCSFDFEFLNDQIDLCTIQSNPNDMNLIYKFNGVSFTKINNINLSESYIKFTCLDYEVIKYDSIG